MHKTASLNSKKLCTAENSLVTSCHRAPLAPSLPPGNWSRTGSEDCSSPTVSPTSLPVAPGFFLEDFHGDADLL